MVSEDVFRQRGVTLLYRSFNLMIQCPLWQVSYSRLYILVKLIYVLRDLWVTYPGFNIYNDVSYTFVAVNKSLQLTRQM